MAQETISLTLDSYLNVSVTTATLRYSTDGWELPESDPMSSTSYSNLRVSWSFGSSSWSGTHTFSNLASGTTNTIKVTVQGLCTQTTVWVDSQGQTHTSSTTITLGTLSTQLTVYTRPPVFSWGISNGSYGISQNDFISNLTAEKQHLWVVQLGKYQSWKAQSSKYNDYNNLKVNKNDFFSASIINNMSSSSEISLRVASGDLITAKIFQDLAQAVS